MFGFPFGFGNHPEQEEDGQQYQQEDFLPNEYYQILGVDQKASTEQIKQSYEKLLSQLHPDSVPEDAEKLQLINQAYETLSDPQKRVAYDSEQVKDSQQTNQNDLLNMFFGGGNKAKANQKPKVQSTKMELQLTLENIYRGDTISVPIKRKRCCVKCEGKGGQNVQICSQCKGQGFGIQLYQVGPGAYQQVQKVCEKCEGKGEKIEEQDKCTECEGKKLVENQKNFQVIVEKGTPNNHPFVFEGQGHQIPDALAGDVILITKQKQHEIFKREGANLIIKKQISLFEALVGVQFQIKHLDGEIYFIKSDEGDVISDGMKKTIKGLGMPFHKKHQQFGNLIIQFQVVMPKRDDLTKQQRNALVQLLPGEVHPRPGENYEMMEDFDKENLNTNEEGGKKPEDEYDEDEQGGQYCQTQ